jgi:DNA-binding MarR family transcriptional regulator
MGATDFIESHPLRDAFVGKILDGLVNQIVEQGDDLLIQAGVIFPSRSASTVLLLGSSKNLSAADIAKMLGEPHQLATQRVDLLITLGIVSRVDDPRDARRKVVRLTPKGRRQLEKLEASLALARAAIAALFEEIECDLSAAALRAKQALGDRSLLERSRAIAAVTA